MIAIRRLQDIDLIKYKTHLLALDDESKRLRFAGRVSDDFISKFVDRIIENPENHKIFVIENNDLEIIGVGHICINDEDMELAFSVLPEYQGRGFGNALMSRCIEWCRNRKITKGHMLCLQSNEKMRHLAKKQGLRMTSEYGETTADIEIGDPTPFSFTHGFIVSNMSEIDHINKTLRKFAISSFQILTPQC